MRIGWLIPVILCSATVIPGCREKPAATPPPPPRTLNVFAAASLTESFRAIGKRFEAEHPGVAVVFNFAGSQQLRAQLEHGAPADVFASANTKEMNAAVAAGLVDAASSKVFVRNRLVAIHSKGGAAAVRSLADLAKPGVKVVVADPAVPVGKYASAMLEAMGNDPAFGPSFKAGVLANVVSREDNVKSVLAKVRLGEADAGVVYVTDAAGDAAKDVGLLPIPDAFNQTADYPIAVTAKPGQPELARQFAAFVVAAEGQQILAGYGFIPAGSTPVISTSPTTRSTLSTMPEKR